MNQRQKNRWKLVREKGKDDFIWMTGVLRWGLVAGFVYSIVMHLYGHQWDVGSLWSMTFVSFASFSLLFFAIAGYFWARVVWRMTEKRYLAEEEQERAKSKKRK